MCLNHANCSTHLTFKVSLLFSSIQTVVFERLGGGVGRGLDKLFVGYY